MYSIRICQSNSKILSPRNNNSRTSCGRLNTWLWILSVAMTPLPSVRASESMSVTMLPSSVLPPPSPSPSQPATASRPSFSSERVVYPGTAAPHFHYSQTAPPLLYLYVSPPLAPHAAAPYAQRAQHQKVQWRAPARDLHQLSHLCPPPPALACRRHRGRRSRAGIQSPCPSSPPTCTAQDSSTPPGRGGSRFGLCRGKFPVRYG